MSEPTRWPLAWPAHKARRPARDRIKGGFVAGGKAITLGAAVDKLDAEINRLGGIYSILSTNVELRLDGRPRAGTAMPSDPGVCLYFRLKDKPHAMACDVFTTVEQNIAAIANHIEATRRIERYGVATAAETLQAFQALPPPGPENRPPKPWHEIFGVVPQAADEETIDALYRVKARALIGNDDGLKELNVARGEAKSAIRAWRATG